MFLWLPTSGSECCCAGTWRHAGCDPRASGRGGMGKKGMGGNRREDRTKYNGGSEVGSGFNADF